MDSDARFVQEIVALWAVHKNYDKEELKAKYYGLKKMIPKFLVNQFKSDDVDENVIRALAVVSKNADDLETTRICLGKLIDCASKSESPSKELDLLELNIDLGAILLEMNKLDQVKKILKQTLLMYQNMVKLEADKKEALKKYLSERGKTLDDVFFANKIGLLKNYEQYYGARDDQAKIVHNGFLVLKYQLKRSTFDPIEWAEHAVNLSPYCCEIRAFRQSHYMLRAAEAVLEQIKTHIKEDPSLQKSNKSRYLEGRIKYGLAQHCLVLLYETKNVSLINEKVQSGATLTRQQEQDLIIDRKITEFEGLELPECDTRLDDLMKSTADIREVYEKTKKLMKDVTNRLTENERGAIGYELVAEKMNDILNSFPFLMSA